MDDQELGQIMSILKAATFDESGTWESKPRTPWRLTTHTRRWRFSGPVTDVLCKLSFAEFFEKNRIRRKRSLADFYQRCGRTTAEWPQFKTATVRDRPIAATHDLTGGSEAVSRPTLKSSVERTTASLPQPMAVA